MATTTRSPTTVVSNAGAWTTPGNVFVSDDARATVTTSGSAEFVVGGFGIAALIGTDTVNSVTVRIEHFENQTNQNRVYVDLLDNGTVLAGGTQVPSRTAEGYDQFTLTGITSAQINNLQLRITGSKQGGSGSRSFNVDHVEIIVDHSQPTNLGVPADVASATTLDASSVTEVVGGGGGGGAPTVAHLHTQFNSYPSTSSTDGGSTPSLSPTAGRRLIAFIHSAISSGTVVDSITISGLGLTWTRHPGGLTSSTVRRIDTYVSSEVGTGQTGALTFTKAVSDLSSISWSIVETSGPVIGDGAFVTGSSTSLTTTLPAPASADSRVIAFSQRRSSSEETTPEAGYTLLASWGPGASSPTSSAGTAWNPTAHDTSPSMSWATSSAGGLMAFELAAAAAPAPTVHELAPADAASATTLDTSSVTVAVPVLVETGDLHVVMDAQYTATIGTGSEGYVVPTATQRSDMAAIWNAVRAGNGATVTAQAAAYGYDVVDFTDTVTSTTWWLLRERVNAGTTFVDRGWGFYCWNRTATPNKNIVQSPHTKSDLRAQLAAMSVQRREIDTQALMFSTTHRNANAAVDGDGDRVSDMANATTSVWQSITEATVDSTHILVQMHGFADSTSSGNEIVLSQGDAPPSAYLLGLDDALTAAGFVTITYDGTVGTELGATGNVQGQYHRSIGGQFVHVEINSTVRTDDTRRTLVATTFADYEGPAGTHALTPADARSTTTVDTATVAQVHALTPVDVASGTTADASSLAQVHVLAPADTASATTMDSTALSGTAAISPADVSSATTLDTATVAQVHALTPADVASGTTLDAATVAQVHALAPADVSSATTADAGLLTGEALLTPSDVLSASSTADGAALTQTHALQAADVALGSSADASSLTQDHALASADVVSASTVDGSALTAAGDVLPSDVSSGSTVDTGALTQVHALTPADTASGTTLDVATVVQIHGLAPADVSSPSSTVEATSLTGQGTLAPNDVRSATTLDASSLAQTHELAPRDTASATRLDTGALGQDQVLGAPADVISATTVDAGMLSGEAILAAADVISASSADATTLTQVHVLATADLAAATALDTAALAVTHLLTPVDVASSTTLDTAAWFNALPDYPDDATLTTRTVARAQATTRTAAAAALSAAPVLRATLTTIPAKIARASTIPAAQATMTTRTVAPAALTTRPGRKAALTKQEDPWQTTN